jgi:Ca-activated chloride channel family protein
MKPTLTCLAYRPAVCSDRATTVTLLVRLLAPVARRSTPPSLNLGIALDRSGSMRGDPLEQAVQASLHLIDNLKPRDLVSAVAFDHEALLLAPARRAVHQQSLKQHLDALQARGGTDLHSGFNEAAHQVENVLGKKKLDRVILLTDGQTNQGVTCPDMIARAVADWNRRGISTTTIGLGWDYNEDLLESMARAGGGNFFHIADPKDIAPLFQVELQGLSSTLGVNAGLKVEPRNGTQLLRLYNKLDSAEDGSIKVGNLMAGQPVELVLELLVPAQTGSGSEALCEFELQWTAVEQEKAESLRGSLQLPVVPFGQLEEFPVHHQVIQKRAVQLALNCVSRAIRHLDAGQRTEAEEAVREGLLTLQEAGSSDQLDDLKQQLEGLKARLQRGEVKEMRKVATYSMSSVSLGGGGLAKLLKEFQALPKSEQTTERMKELAKKFNLGL